MKARSKSVLEVMFEALVPSGHVCQSVGLRQRLRETPLVVADVGAAMGIDPRWKPLGERNCKFITFEPDVRSLERYDNNGPTEMLALLLAYGFHDFAAELEDRAADAELCSAALKHEVDVSVAASAVFPGHFAMRARRSRWPA